MLDMDLIKMKSEMRDEYIKKHGEPKFFTIPFNLDEYLKDPEIKKEYDRLKPEMDKHFEYLDKNINA